MQCPSCRNTKIATYDTRRVEDMVVRKRKCLACDERFYTLEQYMSEDELEEVQELRKNNGGKVLHELPDDAGHGRGDNEKDGQDSAVGMSALSAETQLKPIREEGDQ